jgi:hypothetical protein
MYNYINMSRFEVFEYKLPSFSGIEKYDTNGLANAISRADRRYEEYPNRLRMVARQFPWLNQCLVSDDIARFQALVYEPGRMVGEKFRKEGWHIDNPRHGQRIRILRTSTPTTFAACRLVVDRDTANSIRVGNELFTAGNPAHPNTGVLAFGQNWLEQAAGLEEAVPNPTLGGAKVNDMITEVQELTFIQALPGVLVDGLTEETLHKPSVRHELDPPDSIIFRTLYTPTNEAAGL